MSTASENEAARLLVHYMQTVWEKAGLYWDDDNLTEIELLVENIVAAARIEAKVAIAEAVAKLREEINDEIVAHAREAPHLYADGSTF